jgi:hypothetical protein
MAKGTREMLIQHGYTKEGPFPGDPGERKTSLKTTDPAGREINIGRASKYLFRVSRRWNEEEAEAHRVAVRREADIEIATKLMELWPNSAAEYRKRSADYLEKIFLMVENLLAKGAAGGGYRYNDDAVLRVSLMFDQLRQLVETGGIVFDRQLRDERIPACIRESVTALDEARSDKTFQEWLTTQGIEK